MIDIRLLKNCKATVAIPGSKSYTHRALILSALADGESNLLHALRSEDTDFTAQGLERLGVPVSAGEDVYRVLGQGGRFRGGGEKIYVGNSGTSMRFLAAVAALRSGRTLLDGSKRMRQRPMAGLLEGLSALGVKAYSQEGNGAPPVIIESGGLQGGVARISGRESSQYISALLMAAPLASGDVRIEVTGHLASRPYVEITLDVIASFGGDVQREGADAFLVRGGQRYLPRVYEVEGDASNASYFFAAAAVTRGTVRVENFRSSSIQGDAKFLEILERMGCAVTRGSNFAEVRGQELRGLETEMNAMPDLVPTLAILAAFAEGTTLMKNIGHLRLKESDRISALAGELVKMGVHVEEGRDWLRVEGGGAHGAEIETHQDHRLAMSFAVAGLVVPGIQIRGEGCVDKSFPGFWEEWKKLYL